MCNWKMVHTHSSALPINQTQIFREMVREEWKEAYGGKMRERVYSHQPVSHYILLHPALDPRNPCPGLKMRHGVPKPPQSEGPNDSALSPHPYTHVTLEY